MSRILDRRAADLERANAELRRQLGERTAELREALEQQTAAAEVLQVINSSPGDLAPVFDAMLERAMRLCGGSFGVFVTYEGEHYRVAAARGLSPGLAEFVRDPIPIQPGSMPERLRRGEHTIQIPDIAALGSEHRTPGLVAMIEFGKARTALWVGLRKDGVLQGFFGIYRQEVRPFSDKQIALLQNFAAQAVIAMENARLLTETREALEQQTATADVLRVINSSPGDLAPVFDAILEKAHSLCGVAYGSLELYDGERFRSVAEHGLSARFASQLRQGYRASDSPATQPLLAGNRFTHIADAAQVDFRLFRSAAEIEGIRTVLFVPLRRDDALLGMIACGRREVRPFSEKEIALLENFAAQAVIAIDNARLLTETREALEQQTATAEVLQVINSSPGDLAPVFDAMLEKAMRLCDAVCGHLYTYDGERFCPAAVRGERGFAEWWRRHGSVRPATGAGPLGRIVLGEPIVVTDYREDPAYGTIPEFKALVDAGGLRSGICVALRKDDSLLGTIHIYRQEVRPFTDKQIALLQNFAAQAVIAIDNARLITETREALEQQTATAEVLQVINSSPGDLAPVFDAILEKAHGLCRIALGALELHENGKFRAVAVRGVSGPLAELLRRPFEPPPGSPLARLIAGEQVVQITDMSVLARLRPDDPRAQAGAQYGLHTALFVPLRKDAELLGQIVAFRQEERPFSEKEIALLQNFAAQAVIAMENARLLTETREALEQQTATAEVLQVINSSPGDLAPVFDAVLDKATRFCDAAFGTLWTFDGERFKAVALRQVPEGYAEFLSQAPLRPVPFSGLGRVAAGESVAHFVDVAANEAYSGGDPALRALLDLGKARSTVAVPLRKDNTVLGAITAYRQEVRPFSDKQIALLQNFAAQAVIAMENARLITETREALEQQTATAEVLQVISSSPGDLAPVFEALLEKAMRLCGAAFGMMNTYDGEHFHSAADRGVPPAYAEFRRRSPPTFGPGTAPVRMAAGEHVVHNLDLRAEEAYRQGDPNRRALVDLGGARSHLAVALRKDDALLGYLAIYRQHVQPFSDKQIALLQNFAAQAVIAMENARLITETRERTHDLQESLEYQTATSDVLKVISQSTFDLEPVLQTVLDTAMRLCGNSQGEIFRLEDGVYRMAVGYGMEPDYHEIEAGLAIPPGPDTLVGRTALAGRPVQIIDALADPDYAPKDDAHIGRLRSMLGVPLLREGVPIGVICTARPTVEPFTAKQIDLVRTFADQAVIAIENARLLNELRARTDELARSVEELKMLGEVGQAVSSTLDLRSVLSAILTASLGVTWANAGAVFRYSRAEHAFRLVEAMGWDEALLRSIGDLNIAEAETAMGEAAARRTPIQLADLVERPSAPLRDASLAAGFRSALIVPLVGAERVLGAIILMRHEAGEFPAETVRLMQTLASQSVLAIQNARLFREIADKSEQLALASQHKSQFLANMSHELRTPLNAILGYAELLADGIYGALPERAQGVLERVQNNGRHLLALINDVLDLAKIEAGQLTLTLDDYNLADLVQTVVTATEPLAAAKGLTFTAMVQEGLPRAHGDARRVSQVLLNLVGNAIKFTDRGEIEIGVCAAKGQFVLTVRDTGPGIADADQERIFGEFQQIDNSNTRKQGGTGLGLAISKRMVEMQGGMISVDSVVGQGSTFRVILPVHVEPALEEAA